MNISLCRSIYTEHKVSPLSSLRITVSNYHKDAQLEHLNAIYKIYRQVIWTKLLTSSEIKVQRTLNPKWVNIFAHMCIVCVVVGARDTWKFMNRFEWQVNFAALQIEVKKKKGVKKIKLNKLTELKSQLFFVCVLCSVPTPLHRPIAALALFAFGCLM